MSFLSLGFIFFFVVLVTIYSFIKQENKRQVLLLVASYLFYGCADFRFLAVIIAISIMVWFIGLKTACGKNRGLFILGIFFCLLTLGYYKYFNFFIDSFAGLFGQEVPGALSFVLPLGISFYTFQAISYLCDAHWGKIQAEQALWKVLLYIGFFPQITSGPIVKARDFMPQLVIEHKITGESFSAGIQRVTIGLFKKVVIADRLGAVVNAVYAAPQAYSGFSLLMAACSYAIQIYCDFSGYSDMAIGIAEVFGYDLGRNFEFPYIAKNPSDFWRRWHISLSSWFRDYVYIPLGGNRKGKVRTYFNLFVTMLLSGLWHGANWTFVVWGALHGLTSAIHKMFCDFGKNRTKTENSVTTFFSILVNITFVWLLWIPFRTNTFGEAVTIVTRIFSLADGIEFISVFSVIYIVLIMMIQVYALLRHRGMHWEKKPDFTKFWDIFAFACLVLTIVVFAYIGDTSFIYAQF